MSTKESSISPFLMFTGSAEEAMNFYVSLFPDSKIESAVRYEAGEPGPEGSIKVASFMINNQKVMCSDSPMAHDFTFTPSTSFYVAAGSESEFEKFVEALGDGGTMLMPPDNYGFSTKFCWVQDKFGVSWQVDLA